MALKIIKERQQNRRERMEGRRDTECCLLGRSGRSSLNLH